jgi:hypothetical protein
MSLREKTVFRERKGVMIEKGVLLSMKGNILK